MILMIGTFLGGLGLCLLAVSMITDGLKLAAGEALRGILQRSTRTRLRGVASGVLVTGVVQSSSAVTVATIGFVNAGLLTLSQSLGVVYGANIGTTMTGWLVAAMGFELNVASFALPMIGAGMIARLTGPSRRIGAFGEALAGFGLFFVGVDVLKDAFAGIAASLDVAALSPATGVGLLLYVAFGFLMTLATQSSSAAIAITLTAATGGVLALDAAAAMVIGANVGTTSTAVLAGIGATPNAKRVATAHVIFNAATGVVALILLPVMLRIVAVTGSFLGLADIPAITLALFHSVFNILGVLLMWPATASLAAFLQERFKTAAETLSRPVHLDANVRITPLLGVTALKLELERMAALSREHALWAVGPTAAPKQGTTETSRALTALTDAVESYVSKLQAERMPRSLADKLPLALRINNYIEETAMLAEALALRDGDITAIAVGDMAAPVEGFREQAASALKACDPQSADFDVATLSTRHQVLQRAWRELKTRLLTAASQGKLPVGKLNDALDLLRSCLRIVERSTKITERLAELAGDAEVEEGQRAAAPSGEAAGADTVVT